VADMDGAFPEGFYSTTNQRTQVRLGGRWVDVADQEMDCGIAIDGATKTARCVAMTDVRLSLPIVVGYEGVRVLPVERSRKPSLFGFTEELARAAAAQQDGR